MSNFRRFLTPPQRRLVTTAERQGWACDITSTGHLRFKAPDGRTVIGNAVGRRSLEQHDRRTVNRLRRHGLRIDP